MIMTEEEKQRFIAAARNALTTIAIGLEQLNKVSTVFTARGGKAAFGDTLGADAEEIIALSAELNSGLNAAQKTKLAKFRTDI